MERGELVSKKGKRGGARGKRDWPVWPKLTCETDPGRTPIFQPPFWLSLVLIWSLSDAGRILVVIAAEKRPEHRWSKLERPRLNLFSSLSISSDLGRTTTWILFLSSPLSFSKQPRHLKQSDCRWSATWKLAAWEAQSAAVAARGWSLPAPLDSLRLERSNLGFPSPLIELRSSLTGKGNSVISQTLGVSL